MSAQPPASAESQVRYWIDNVVVGLNICPFAKRELDAGRVRVCEPSGLGMQEALEAFADEAIQLVNSNQTATTLLILPQGFEDFDDYLDLLEMSEALLEECGWDEALQLASFHPDYCFEGVEDDDPANFTNRSPLPIIHLLRQDDVAQAIANYPEVDRIPDNNQYLARERGAPYFLSILEACREVPK